MSKIELAKQGFRSLSPLLEAAPDETVSDRAESWLRNEVCPIVSELSDVAKFREAALWGATQLSQDETAPERRLLANADRYLVELASALADAVRFTGGAITEDDSDVIRFISERPWVELASPLDFFHPTQLLFLGVTDPGGRYITRFRERELRDRLGDYVTESMLARIEFWRQLLWRLANTVRQAMPSSQPGDSEVFASSGQILESEFKLDRTIDQLTDICQAEPEKQMRDACTALTQVYACYSNRPRLQWIPCDRSWIETSRDAIRSVIRRPTTVREVEQSVNGAVHTVREHESFLCDLSVLRQVAAALETVSDLIEFPDDPERTIEAARVRATLVLVDGPVRRVYWMGESVDVDWDANTVEWNLLYILARNANTPVDIEMLQNPRKNPIKARRNRLSGSLECYQELDDKIETVRGSGYLLRIDPEDVIVLEWDGNRLINRR